MNYPTRSEWIEALRSGKYNQNTNGYLFDEFKIDDDWEINNNGIKNYCCLGVACDLADVELNHFNRYELNTWKFDNIMDISSARKLDNSLGIDKNIRCALARLNDDGYSFNQIADIIEAGNEAILTLTRRKSKELQ